MFISFPFDEKKRTKKKSCQNDASTREQVIFNNVAIYCIYILFHNSKKHNDIMITSSAIVWPAVLTGHRFLFP